MVNLARCELFIRKKIAQIKDAFSSSRAIGDFRVVALLAVRNEELYLEKCLTHLFGQGVEACVIDNDSTDRTLEIAKKFLGNGVMRIENYYYGGFYDWYGLLKLKEELSYEIEADWFIHQDADEIREAPLPFNNLREAIWEVDRLGYNAINFDEFVFVPTDETDTFEGEDYVSAMKYYYFFKPAKLPQVKAWKKTIPINLAEKAGHQVKFANRKIFPINFILRHYIFLSKNHGISKYCNRVFSPEELKRGWHGKRAEINPNTFKLPSKKEMKVYQGDRRWDRSEPCKKHKFL